MALRLSRTVLLHIPKTGTDWVRAACAAAVRGGYSEIGEWHADLAEVVPGLSRSDRPLLATFVRHPLTWYRSAWAYWMQTGRFPRTDEEPKVECPDFEQFVTNCLAVAPEGYVTRRYARYLEGAGHCVDFVGRQEHLVEDLVCLLSYAEEDFDETLLRALPRQNVRGSDPDLWFPGYSPQLLDAVLESEPSIIQRFYAHEPVPAGLRAEECLIDRDQTALLPDRSKPFMSLSIIIVTSGRATLSQTLQSLREQEITDRDEVLLVHDGPECAGVRSEWQAAGLPGSLIFLDDGPHGDWGHTPRNVVLSRVQGDYVVHMDDDDEFAPGALAGIRQAISAWPGDLFLFQMQFASGRILWTKRRLSFGDVGTPMFVHPSRIPVGRWEPRRGGDFDFIQQTTALNPERTLRWVNRVIALIRPPVKAPSPTNGLLAETL